MKIHAKVSQGFGEVEEKEDEVPVAWEGGGRT